MFFELHPLVLFLFFFCCIYLNNKKTSSGDATKTEGTLLVNSAIQYYALLFPENPVIFILKLQATIYVL